MHAGHVLHFVDDERQIWHDITVKSTQLQSSSCQGGSLAYMTAAAHCALAVRWSAIHCLYMRRSSAMEACTRGPCMGARHSTSRLSTSGLTPSLSSPKARS